MKEILARILYYVGCLFRRDPKILSIYFHDVKPESFERSLQWCKKHGYRFISIEELLAILKGSVKQDGKCVYVSFDDGRKGNLELIPLFEKYQAPVTIFCAVQPIVEGGGFWWDYVLEATGSRKLVELFKTLPEEEFKAKVEAMKQSTPLGRQAVTVDEMKAMDKTAFVNVQSHTVNHPILTSLSDEHLDYELKESKRYLSETLKKDVFAFSYPNGSLSEREVEAARRHYGCAVTTEEKYPRVGCDIYRIPRIVQTEDYWTNLARIKGMWKIVDRLKKYVK